MVQQEQLVQLVENREQPVAEVPHEDLAAHGHLVGLDQPVEPGRRLVELEQLEGVVATLRGHARTRGVQWLGTCLEEDALRVVLLRMLMAV